MEIARNKIKMNHKYRKHDKFERVESFLYLGSLTESQNDIKKEIDKRIQSANKSYFEIYKSKFITRETKVRAI